MISRNFVGTVCLLIFFGAVELGAQEQPNYLVTDLFETTDPELFYTVSDFNNERMVCGEWRRYNLSGGETDRGIFVWRDGVMRHITPALGGLQFVRSPESLVRMTNVLPDGTIFLVAAAIQTTEDDGNGPRGITRTIRYSIKADLASFPQPVVSAIALRGRLNPNISAPYIVEENSGGGSDLDVTDEGTVMAGSRILDTTGGFAQQWFAEGFQDSWGNLSGLDRNGNAYGFAPNNEGNPPGSFHYTTPLAGLTPMGGTTRDRWPVPTWAESATGLLSFAVHGAFRVGTPFSGSQTGVWTNGFADEVILPQFQIHSGITSTNRRNCLTRNGHLLGYDLSVSTVLARATAIRGAAGSYEVRTVADQLAHGYKTVPPYANPQSTNPDFEPFVLAINDNLDWVAELWTANSNNGRGFFILRDQPGPGEIVHELIDTRYHEDSVSGVTVYFDRRFGRSGAASLRVTLAAGGTARPGSDFAAGETAVVEWAANETGLKAVNLPLINDPYEEPEETVNVVVSEVVGSTYEGETGLSFMIFANDEEAGPEPDPNAAVLAQIATLEQEIETIAKKLTAAKKIKNRKVRAKRIKALNGQRIALYTRIGFLGNSLQ